MMKIIRNIFITAALTLLSAFPLWAADTELTTLIRSALTSNSDISAAGLDISSEQLSYDSLKAGNLPSLNFTTDTGNNPLYKFSNADEFSTDTFETDRYNRHNFGGGLNIETDLPTGGTLSLTGAGGLDIGLAETENSDWQYQLNPAASLYLRQPLFIDKINGSLMRLDNLELADELASEGIRQAERNLTELENSLILLITNVSAVLNSLRNSNSILDSRIALAEKRVELALRDEEAGRLSSLDRLSEELQIRVLQETRIELDYQIKNTESDLAQLTGIKLPIEGYIKLPRPNKENLIQINPGSSLDVQNSEAAARTVELSATAIQNGNEPVFEVSALYRRSDSNTASDLSEAFDGLKTAEMDLSVSLALSIPLFDWGELEKDRESERKKLLAADARVESAKEAAILASESALNNIKLIEEKIILLAKGLEYDRTLLERENVRLAAGLSSEAAVETIKLDLLEREFSIKQLEDEKVLAIMELYDTGGIELKTFLLEE